MTDTPVPLPAHLPESLTITLWDFSWYVRTGPGEPFDNLDAAFAAARERGYNTIRICAMPYLLFGSGLDTSALTLGPLGGEIGQRMRWYDVTASTTIDARAHLLELFRAARRHEMFVIASSWEYQQSPAFAATEDWYRALHAVDPEQRAVELARSLAALMDFLGEHGLADRVAFVELHNEVQIGHLTAGLGARGAAAVPLLTDRLERGLAEFHALSPGVPVTVNYAEVPVAAMSAIPVGVDVLVFHPYVYGVLQALIDTYGLRGELGDYDQAAARADLLRPGAPDLAEWVLPAEDSWRLDASIVAQPEMYTHDWCDPAAFDRWLYEHYGTWREQMATTLTLWLEVAADAARARGVPLVLGEGWVGYTPLHGTFEEGPVGAEICRRAVAESARVGAWGTIVCSNAAPQHPMWADVALQVECNDLFTRRTPAAPPA